MSWLWKSVVGKLWVTIMALVAIVIIILGMFLLQYIDIAFQDSHEIKMLFIYIGVLGFLLTTFFAFFLLTQITQPLQQLRKAADLIAQGEYRTRVPIRTNDEIGQLGNTFNRMGTELETLITDLHDEKDHLSSVLRSMADAVITFDAEGKVILANPLGEQILEKWNELKWEAELKRVRRYGEVPVPLYELYRDVLREGKDISTKLNVMSGVWSVVMAPLRSKDSIRGAVAVLRDVTEEFKLEKFRRDFVANVTHEIRTPLSMLQGYSEALLDDIASTPEERTELVQVIYDESVRMGRLVNDLLDLARMEAGHMEMQRQVVDMSALLIRVHRKFNVIAKEQGIQLVRHLPEESMLLEAADEDRLEQVLTNLLDNALRHTGSGATITIEAVPTVANGNQVVQLAISDEGIGIPREDLPYIFERFYKADKARTRGASGGTGLGLAIVKNIVDAHNGTISARSEVGVGTTFTLLFPVKA